MIPLFKDGGQGGQQINRALGGSKILFYVRYCGIEKAK